MLITLLLLVVGTARADDLVVSVPRSVERVVLQCGDQRYEQTVPRSASAMVDVGFPIRPGRECHVSFVQSAGQLTQMGSWSCTTAGCEERQQDIGAVESLPPGHIKIVSSQDLPHPTVELSCPTGYRQRTAISDHIALFTGVPEDDCTLMYKGGPPYQFRPMGWGTWACSVVSQTLVCDKRG